VASFFVGEKIHFFDHFPPKIFYFPPFCLPQTKNCRSWTRGRSEMTKMNSDRPLSLKPIVLLVFSEDAEIRCLCWSGWNSLWW